MPALHYREKALRDRVVVRYLTARLLLAAWSMDQLARLSLLEGAAGVPPGTWLRQKSRGFGAALDHFGPNLAGGWTAPTDQGVYDKALAVASRVLRDVARVDANDLLQDLVIGSARSGGPARHRLFYSVGSALRKYENDLGQGAITPHDRRIKGTIDRWVTRAARDVLRTQKKEEPSGTILDQVSAKMLDDDTRTNLLILAFQSPGGSGLEMRRQIDRLIDVSFPSGERPIVRMFLQKLGEPRYRSMSEVRRLVSNFDPAKWFVHVYNIIRKELMTELDVSSQRLTNVLGPHAKKVFRFMRERVARDPKVQRIVEELANEIEILEPGVSRIGKKKPKDKEREATLVSDTAFASEEAEVSEQRVAATWLGRKTL